MVVVVMMMVVVRGVMRMMILVFMIMVVPVIRFVVRGAQGLEPLSFDVGKNSNYTAFEMDTVGKSFVAFVRMLDID